MKVKELSALLENENPEADIVFLTHVEFRKGDGPKIDNGKTFMIGQTAAALERLARSHDEKRLYLIGEAL